MRQSVTDYFWLPHLSNEVASVRKGGRIDAYYIALEGWRRGLTLIWYSKPSKYFTNVLFKENEYYSGKLYSLSSSCKTHYFYKSRGDKNTYEAYQITQNKIEAKELLMNAGIPVPEGKGFKAEAPIEEIISYAQALGFPVVIKPVDQGMGRGVFTNINTVEALADAVSHVRQELDYREIMVEKHCTGNDYRFFVINDQVVGAVERIPANIVGDGVNCISSLIEIKNGIRRKNPYLSKKPIKVDHEVIMKIKQAGYTLDSVPPAGELIYVRGKSNVAAGGDPVDATDRLSGDIKAIAIKALRASGLQHGGVDMIVNENSGVQRAVVLELGSAAGYGSHLFPIKGLARDIPSAMIDCYFPETKNIPKSPLYFNINEIIKPLESGAAATIEVSPAPRGHLYALRYLVLGDIQGVGYRRWIKRKALENNLNGYCRNLQDGSVEVVAAGVNENMLHEFKNVCAVAPEKARVDSVVSYSWDKPVHIGFVIIESKYSEKQVKVLESKLKQKSKELKQVKAELKGKPKSPVWRFFCRLK